MSNLISAARRKFTEDGPIEFSRAAWGYIRKQPGRAVRSRLANAFASVLWSRRSVSVFEISDQVYSYGDDTPLRVTADTDDLPPDLDAAIGNWPNPKQEVAVLDDVRLVGHLAIGFSEDGRLIRDTVHDSKYILEEGIKRTFRRQGIILTSIGLGQAVIGIGGTHYETDRRFTMSMSKTNANNYYHWIIEHLARLRAIEEGKDETPNNVELLLHPGAPGFVQDYLELLGYEYRTEWGSHIRTIDSLLVPRHTLRSRSHEFGISPDDLDWVRSRVKTEVSNLDGPAERVFISRVDAKNGREILNSDEVTRIIKDHGFDTYTLGELDIEEQIRLFHRAEVVLGAHGAGLGNMLFSDETAIIELYGETIPQGAFFFVLANELGHDYSVLECPDDGRDISVPCDTLDEVLSQDYH